MNFNEYWETIPAYPPDTGTGYKKQIESAFIAGCMESSKIWTDAVANLSGQETTPHLPGNQGHD